MLGLDFHPSNTISAQLFNDINSKKNDDVSDFNFGNYFDDDQDNDNLNDNDNDYNDDNDKYNGDNNGEEN